MKAIKIIFICVAIIVFLAAATIGFLGAIGKIQFSTNGSVFTLCGSCLGMVATVLNAKHLFEDPEAVQKLKTEHHDTVLRLKAEQAEAISDLKQKNADAVSLLKEEHAQTIRRIQSENDERIMNFRETNRKLQAQIPKNGSTS